MKAVVQRVTSARVTVAGEMVGQIGAGLVILLGVANGDTEKDADFLAQKITGLRIMADEAGKFNLSAIDKTSELLAVSQFTLLADTRKAAGRASSTLRRRQRRSVFSSGLWTLCDRAG